MKPFHQIRVRLLEDRPGLGTDLVTAAGTDEVRRSSLQVVLPRLTALRTFLVAVVRLEQVLEAGFVIGKLLLEVHDGVLGRFHGRSVGPALLYVKG